MPEEVKVQTPQVSVPKGRFELPPEEAPKVETPVVQPAESTTPVAQKQEEQAPPTEPEVKPEEVTPEQAAKREGRRFERRLDKAYRQRAEAQARAELLEKQIAELRQASQPAPVEGAPTLEKFDFDPEKYAQAKAEFAAKQEREKVERERREEAEKQSRTKLLSGWQEKVEAAEDKYEDFAEKVGDLQPNSPFAVALMEEENGADVAYYLGSHPKEAQRIAQLSPLSQAREIGKLAVKIAAEPEKPKAPSKAPPPIAPLQASQPVVEQGPKEDDDIGQWIKKRRKQVYGNR